VSSFFYSYNVSAETRIAKILSYLFHPFLMPTYGLLLYFCTVEPYMMGRLPVKAKLALTTITFLFTFLLPVISVLFLYRAKYITSLEIQSPQERRWPFLVTACCYIGAYYIMPSIREFAVIRALILGATLSVVLTLAINLYTKISAHMVGIGGLVGAFIALSYRLTLPFELVIFGVLIVAGLIGFARLALNAHTPVQVYLGFALGFACELGLFLLLP
jgi:hypothetical protein